MPTPASDTHNADAAVVRCVAYDDAGRLHGDISIEAISDTLEQPGLFVWIGLCEPDTALLETLQEEFGLHDLAINDTQEVSQGTKINAFGDSLFMAVRTVQPRRGRLGMGETHLFLGKRYLITIRRGTSQSYTPVRNACEASPELLALGPSYCLYAVLDFIVDNYLSVVSGYQSELTELEKDVFADTNHRDTIRKLYEMQRHLMAMRLATAPLQDVTNLLMRRYPALVHDATRVYYHDVYDHVSRVNEIINAMREMLGAAMDVNQSLAAFGQNEVAKRLASWAAMLAAPTLITSWFGMNFQHMPELQQPWAYPAMVVITAAVIGTLYFTFRRAKWL